MADKSSKQSGAAEHRMVSHRHAGSSSSPASMASTMQQRISDPHIGGNFRFALNPFSEKTETKDDVTSRPFSLLRTSHAIAASAVGTMGTAVGMVIPGSGSGTGNDDDKEVRASGVGVF